MSKIGKLATKIRAAQDAMVKELERQFPIGTTVRCEIQYGQINPSIGLVIAHEGGEHAYVCVRLQSRTKEVRRVPASNIW